MGHRLTEIPVTIPPNLIRLIGYPAGARYIALFYYGSKPNWTDGRATATFSFYSAYQPFIDHPAIAIHLLERDLGSDDGPPTHALVLDREERKIFVGEFAPAIRFVREQFTEEPAAGTDASYEEMFTRPTNLQQYHALGRFEIFGRPDPAAQAQTSLLLKWLDTFITEDLISRYIKMLDEHDWRAMPHLQYIKRLAERTENVTNETEQPDENEQSNP